MIKKFDIKKKIINEMYPEYWIVLFLPILAIFSIFLLEFCLIILSLSFISRNIFFFEKKFLTNKFLFFFLIFYFYLILRYFFSKNYDHESYLFVIFYFRYGLYVITIYYFLIKIKNLDYSFYRSIIFCVILLAIDSLIQFYTGKNIIGYEMIDNNRVSSFFGEESILGSYLLKILPFLYLCISSNSNKKYIYLIIFLIVVTNALIFISGERAAFILMLLMTFYFVFMVRILKKIKLFLILFMSISIVLVFFNFEGTQKRYLQTIKEMIQTDNLSFFSKNFSEEEKIEANRVNTEILDPKFTVGGFYLLTPTHHNYFLTSYNMFKDNKLIGHGPKSFRNLCKENKYSINRNSCSSHPHNYYIQLLAEFGLAGFIIPFFVFVYFLAKIIQSYFKNYYNYVFICLYSFMLINLWPITSTGNFFNNWISILVYIPFSFYLYYLDKKHE